MRTAVFSLIFGYKAESRAMMCSDSHTAVLTVSVALTLKRAPTRRENDDTVNHVNRRRATTLI